MEMKNILILLDYRRQFWLTTIHKEANFDIHKLCDNFRRFGYEVLVKGFSDINLGEDDFKNWFVVYQSTEDPNLYYKSFIDDILFGLTEQGATIIPEYRLFKAHHNKVFMEILRELKGFPEMKLIRSRYYGTFEEYRRWVDSKEAFFPHVVKKAEGAQSKNVLLIDSRAVAKNRVKKLMSSIGFTFWLKDQIKPFMPKTYPNYKRKSHHRYKIIVQNFIDGLEGDFKILVFGEKYYVLYRKVRKNDFRASGSGLFAYRHDIPDSLLDFTKKVYDLFGMPMISVDVAQKHNRNYLVEFQFVHFGTYTIEKAPHYFVCSDGKWQLIEGQSDLEREFAFCIHKYIESIA